MRAILVVIVAACVTPLPDSEAPRRAEEVFRQSFAHGDRQMAASVEQQDEVQLLCSKYRNEPPKDVAERIEKSQTATIRYPASGKLMGDWRQGERIAQDGYGLRFT